MDPPLGIGGASSLELFRRGAMISSACTLIECVEDLALWQFFKIEQVLGTVTGGFVFS